MSGAPSRRMVETIIESLYAQAVEKPVVFVSEGGVPVDERWWEALVEAYLLGHADALDGLHDIVKEAA